MSSKEKLNRAYLESKVNKILEPLVVDLVSTKPEQPVRSIYHKIQFMIDWLKEHHGNRASGTIHDSSPC